MKDDSVCTKPSTAVGGVPVPTDPPASTFPACIETHIDSLSSRPSTDLMFPNGIDGEPFGRRESRGATFGPGRGSPAPRRNIRPPPQLPEPGFSLYSSSTLNASNRIYSSPHHKGICCDQSCQHCRKAFGEYTYFGPGDGLHVATPREATEVFHLAPDHRLSSVEKLFKICHSTRPFRNPPASNTSRNLRLEDLLEARGTDVAARETIIAEATTPSVDERTTELFEQSARPINV